MKIILLAIGNELLEGKTINSNGSFISLELSQRGYVVEKHLVIADEPLLIFEEITSLKKKADLILVTGGLGPTEDDRTKAALARSFARELILDTTLLKELQKRFPHLQSLEGQAMVPKEAKLFPNSIGTASGFLLEDENCSLIALPGVPKEMKAILLEEVLPFIEESFSLKKRRVSVKFHLAEEIEEEVDRRICSFHLPKDEVEVGIYPDEGLIHLTFSSLVSSNKKIDPLFKKIREKLKSYYSSSFYENSSGKIEEVLAKELIHRKSSLILAESCTGGFVSSTLTSMAGASSFFKGSFITYSNEMKQEILGVPVKELDGSGAVSKEVVLSMAKGALKKGKGDYVIAISGIAGPSGEESGKPIGTVWFAIGSNDQLFAVKRVFKGDRQAIIKRSTHFALSSLWKWIAFKEAPCTSS